VAENGRKFKPDRLEWSLAGAEQMISINQK